MKALVTGGTGFIGSHLIDLLLEKEVEILALVRNPAKARWLKDKKVNILQGDLFSIPSLPDDITSVFHLAGITRAVKQDNYYTVNQRGTASLFQTLSTSGINPRVICLSSLAAAGPSQAGRPSREEDPPSPITSYGRSKLLSEEEALKCREKYHVTIVRVGAVFGPRDTAFLPYFKILRRGILPVVRPRRYLSLCYVKDLANGLYLGSQKNHASGEIFNLGDPRLYSWEDMSLAAARAMGKKLRRIRFPLRLVYWAALVSEISARLRGRPGGLDLRVYKDMKQANWEADTEKAARILSFRPRYTLEEAMKETISWYLKEGWL